MDEPLRLAELLCSRLCHDLSGPTGAVSNGAELLEENDPDLVGEAAELMAGAAGQLAKRLRFYRAAFGWEGGGAASLAEAGRIGADYLAPLPGQPPRFIVNGPTGPEPEPGGLRLLLLLLLLGSESLSRGGTLSLAVTPSQIEVIAEGNGAELPEDHAALLAPGKPPPKPSPRTAPVLLALGLAERFDWQISIQSSENRVIFRAKR